MAIYYEPLKPTFSDRSSKGVTENPAVAALKKMGLASEDIYYRNVGKSRLQFILIYGTDRAENSELYTDSNAGWESLNRYEELAMCDHDIKDRRFTTYLHDGVDLAPTVDKDSRYLILLYRKDPAIIRIKAHEYNPECVPQSGGFSLFKEDPSKFLIGIVKEGKFYTPAQLREEQPSPELAQTM